MNDNDCDNAKNDPIYINNEETPETAVFDGTTSSPAPGDVGAAAASSVPDANGEGWPITWGLNL